MCTKVAMSIFRETLVPYLAYDAKLSDAYPQEIMYANFSLFSFALTIISKKGIVKAKETSINDVRRFLAIFDLPTLSYPILGAILEPYPNIGQH